MSSYTIKSIDDLDAIHNGAIKLAGAELGVQSFGMQVVDLPAGFSDYPEHDHSDDGQEEVYLVLRGSAEVQVEGRPVALHAEDLVRVAPEVMRKLAPGPDGARILAIGAAADRPYRRPEHFRLEVRA